MAGKKKTNKELTEEIETLIVKQKVLENLVKELAGRPSSKDLEKKINELEQKVSEIDSMKERMIRLEAKVDSIENMEEELKELCQKANKSEENIRTDNLKCEKCDYSCISKSEMKKHKKENHPNMQRTKKCNICDEMFKENCELELHLKTHQEAETFDCEKCGKTFQLKWRLRKHMHVHDTYKFCHHFNNNKCCPFEEIGCKFRHELSSTCKFNTCNNSLCQYRHEDNCDAEEVSVEKVIQNEADLDSTKCDKCSKECYNTENLNNHIKRVHDRDEEYDEYSKFLKEKQSQMKNMNPSELFELVQEMQKRDPSKN